MGRFDHRIRRLTAQVQGSAGSLAQARIQRMTDDELVDEIRRIAAKHGHPADQVPADLDGAALWCEEQLRTMIEAAPEEEREEWKAQHGIGPAPSGRPWP